MKADGWKIIALGALPLGLLALWQLLPSGSTTLPPAGLQADRHPTPAVTAPAPPPADTPPQLEIGASDWSWRRSDDAVVVAGQARNISARPLRDVVAEVSFFDGNGRFIASAEALVFPATIQAGQTVRFEVRRAWDPAIREARVGFQDIIGVPLETRRRESP